MTIENTSSVSTPENVQMGINFDNTDSTTKNLWVPANGNRLLINDIVVSVINKANSSYIIVGVQVFINGSWQTLIPLAVGAQAGNTFSHNFGGRIRSDIGDGTNARVRVAKMGTSTNWESQIVITGKEV